MVEVETVFTCQRCGGHRLEEVMRDVTQTSVIACVENVAGMLQCDYDDVLCEGGEVSHYQCANCGEVVAETADELLDLLQLPPVDDDDDST